jgi:hypothetical protein
MKRFLVVLALCLFSVFNSCRDSADSNDEIQQPPPTVHDSPLATVLDSMRYAYKLPALAGAIICDTSVLDAQAVGCRRYGGLANVTNNDQFHIGSDTKAITAVLIGLLVDEDLLNWDSTLSLLFPEYAQTMRMRSPVTVAISFPQRCFSQPIPINAYETTLTEQRLEVVAWRKYKPTNAIEHNIATPVTSSRVQLDKFNCRL